MSEPDHGLRRGHLILPQLGVLVLLNQWNRFNGLPHLQEPFARRR